MHNLFRGVILLSKLLCAPHILEYAAVLNIIFPKNPSFIFRLCKRSTEIRLITSKENNRPLRKLSFL
ncbi:hypothetical protein [Candidatus Sarmatiella mevalonica]|uniref:hypothetical protein n=1 Tax=Candidatus Sarmatiella mevalonica TaxID=2770581 RepID=UPI0019219F8D|nr:hypothetical protein [Candidatus Sarmatiella mevalonica]